MDGALKKRKRDASNDTPVVLAGPGITAQPSLNTLLDRMDIDSSQSQSQSQRLSPSQDRRDSKRTGNHDDELTGKEARKKINLKRKAAQNGSGGGGGGGSGFKEIVEARLRSDDVNVRRDGDGGSAADGEESEVVHLNHERRKRTRKEQPAPAPETSAWNGISTSSSPEKPMGSSQQQQQLNGGNKGKSKKSKLLNVGLEIGSMEDDAPEAGPSTSANGRQTTLTLTPMQQAMKDKLEGGRFRLINETLYKSDSKAAHKMMAENPRTFEEYHLGFRRQVTSWPTNPVAHYITALSAYSKDTLVVDLGCGDASLAKALVPKGFRVLSYDLASDGEYVVEADVCERLPLPGVRDGGGRIVDVVVCALSLMSLNWIECLREARRVLRDSGELKIAEVTSRFTDVDAFVSIVSDLGFRLQRKDHPTTHFTLFEFKIAPPPSRQPTPKEWQNVLKSSQRLLKPCEYKRR